MADTIALEDAKSAARAIFSKALSSAAVGGFMNAEEEGHPLTELQKEDILTMHIMEYHDAIVEFEDSLDAMVTIDTAARRARRSN